MGKEHLSEYIEGVVVPKFSGKLLFVCDAWSTFTEKNIMKQVPGSLDMSIRQIPPGATGMIQPWDKFGFRIYKNFVKHLSDFVTLNEIPVLLHQRNKIIRLQSLV